MKSKLVILGAKESGLGAAKLAVQKGYEVFVTDYSEIQENYVSELNELGIEWEQGTHSLAKILEADTVVISPGVPNSAQIVKEIQKAGIELISEIEFAYRHKNADSKIIAITGSNGKTTTTLWCQYILETAKYSSTICGNIGYSFSRALVEKPAKHYVLEVSSFQLDNIVDFCPDISILLNITPDHLDRYDYKFENYIASKFKIINNQKSNHSFVFNADDETICTYLKTVETSVNQLSFSLKKTSADVATCISNDEILFKTPEKTYIMVLKRLSLAGSHNLQNAMAAGTALRSLDIDEKSMVNALSTFVNAEHRMEKVRFYSGVTFINDSKATNVNSVWYALESVPGPIIWLVGGVDKGNDYELLKELVGEKVDAIICIGKDNKKIIDSFDDIVNTILEIPLMDDAVAYAFKYAKPGSTVLLSPACSSFDFYENYEDRGEQFQKAAVKVRRENTIL